MTFSILWLLFFVVAAIAILLWIAHRSHPLQVRPVTQLTIMRQNQSTFTSKGSDIMEKYRAAWNPSPSTFVEKNELRGSIGGAADAVLVPDLPPSAFEATFDVESGAECDVYIRTYGDNATTADSLHVRFTASNEQAVAPVEDLDVNWISHTD